MKTLLGSKFFKKKKFPFPVFFESHEEGKLDLEKTKQLLKDLEHSSLVHLGNGSQFNLKIGRSDM